MHAAGTSSAASTEPKRYEDLSEFAAPTTTLDEKKSGSPKEYIDKAELPNTIEKQDSEATGSPAHEIDHGIPTNFINSNEIRAPPFLGNAAKRHCSSDSFLESRSLHDDCYNRNTGHGLTSYESREEDIVQHPEARSQASSSQEAEGVISNIEQASKLVTELYTLSYLVLFSILGTLSRLGIEALTTYPGSPAAISGIWVNFSGSLILGFLSEDRQLFNLEDNSQSNIPTEIESDDDQREDGAGETNMSGTVNPSNLETNKAAARKAHMALKKTIPLYIGLATGFCGSFTSFSTFILDVFLALSNNAPTIISSDKSSSIIPRNGGFSFMAVLAHITLTICLCLSGLKLGAHIAIAAQSITPAIPIFFMRKILDRTVVVLAWSAWLGAVFMTIWPPDRPSGPAANGNTSWSQETWRGQVLCSLVFSPLGCVGRFYASVLLNGMSSTFPVGTFVVNVFGTIIFGVAWDLQRAPLISGDVGGGQVGCQVLQGVQDGFCACFTTVSTWILELTSLRRRHAYFYGAMSVGISLCALVAIMGTLLWTRGFSEPACSL
jgi:fluoride exporter